MFSVIEHIVIATKTNYTRHCVVHNGVCVVLNSLSGRIGKGVASHVAWSIPG